jgi:hypothetical protein
VLLHRRIKWCSALEIMINEYCKIYSLIQDQACAMYPVAMGGEALAPRVSKQASWGGETPAADV